VVLLFVAIISKLIGTFIGASFDHLSRAQTWLVGWAMNSRGAI
jgi:Kef-type K+ transport system membrane component KefB